MYMEMRYHTGVQLFIYFFLCGASIHIFPVAINVYWNEHGKANRGAAFNKNTSLGLNEPVCMLRYWYGMDIYHC